MRNKKNIEFATYSKVAYASSSRKECVEYNSITKGTTNAAHRDGAVHEAGFAGIFSDESQKDVLRCDLQGLQGEEEVLDS
jgi:hypothetical protein